MTLTRKRKSRSGRRLHILLNWAYYLSDRLLLFLELMCICLRYFVHTQLHT